MSNDMITFEKEMKRLRGSHIFDIAPAIEMYRALLDRVEVLDVAFANSHQLNESLGDENRALRARVEAAEAEVAEWKTAYADNELINVWELRLSTVPMATADLHR